MVWTSPMTAVANAAFTAAQFNQHVRDNLNETGPAKASATGRWIVTSGVNQITELERPAISMSKDGGPLKTASTWHFEGGWTHDSGSPHGSGITYNGSGVFEVASAGIYSVFFHFGFSADSSGTIRATRIVHNTTMVAVSGIPPNNQAFALFECSVPRLQMAATDTVTVQSQHNASSNLAATSNIQRVAIELVEPL